MANDNSQAMQNLFSAYGGDEDDGDDMRQQNDANISDDEHDLPVSSQPTPKVTPEPSEEEPPAKIPKIERKVTATRLVSYGPDDLDDDDEEEEEHEDKNESDNQSDSSELVMRQMLTQEELNSSISKSLRHSLSEEDVQIPPEPTGNCSRKLQDKVAKLYEKMLRDGTDLNSNIQRRKDFRNPSIYDKLIEFCGIDEKGTNYPPELFNPTIWGPESNYEELARIQRQEMEKREKDKKDKKDKSLTVERLHGTKKPISKWDSTSSSATAVQIPAVGPLTKP